MAEVDGNVEPGEERFVNQEEAAKVEEALKKAKDSTKQEKEMPNNDTFRKIAADEPTVPTISTQERLNLQGVGTKLEPVKVENKPSGIVGRITRLFRGK